MGKLYQWWAIFFQFIILIDWEQNMEINLRVLEEILSLRKISHIRNLMSSRAKHHFLTQKDLVITTKRDIIHLAHSLNDRRLALPCNGDSLTQKWMWGEQKLFIWVLIYYSGAALVEVNALGHQQFQKIAQLFPSKNPVFLNYEFTLTFASDPQLCSQWAVEEIELLEQIYSEEGEGENRWKKISYKLYKQSQGRFFKPAETCRNRWENHSNPRLKKSPWTPEEDLRMLECIMENGMRWAAVAKKACAGRNEHMIKNRYRSLIKKLKINQKGKTLRSICEAVMEKAGLLPLKVEGQEVSNQETPMEEKMEESGVATQTIGEGEKAEQTECAEGSRPVEESRGLSVSEIMDEMYLNEFGDNHRYMSSLDDGWLDRIMDNHYFPSPDAFFDIYCP